MDETAELYERDEAMKRIQTALVEIESEIRQMIIESPYARLRIDLRSLLLDIADTRHAAIQHTSWYHHITPLRPLE